MFSLQITQSALNKELLQLFYKKVYQDWDMELVDELIAPDFISHEWPKGLQGPEGFKTYYAAFKKAISKARYHLQDVIAESDRVVVRWEMRGIYSGVFPGIYPPPNGQSISIKGIAIYRIERQMLKECWVVSDPDKFVHETKIPRIHNLDNN